MSPRIRRSATVVIALVLVSLAGCGGDDGAGDAERFCGEVAKNKKALTSPDFASAQDPNAAIESLLDEYRRIGEFAPLEIEEEWSQLISAYEMAAVVDPDDGQTEQEALASIFRTEKAAVKVAAWLKTNCNVRLGPVATIVGTAVTSTVDPATTQAP